MFLEVSDEVGRIQLEVFCVFFQFHDPFPVLSESLDDWDICSCGSVSNVDEGVHIWLVDACCPPEGVILTERMGLVIIIPIVFSVSLQQHQRTVGSTSSVPQILQ